MTRDRRPSPQTAAVLRVLAGQAPRWSHGYASCGKLQRKAGTVYRILIRLAGQHHLESRWEAAPPSGRPPRHLYRLTAAGLEPASSAQRRDPLASTVGFPGGSTA